ncbi:MAG: hypothetical protein LBB34_02790 [Holosporales bacterium]|jgi:3-deoxy-D-manno-octulosonic-acid transferase|nr:hypothetical protein [Holosporales bacterium]
MPDLNAIMIFIAGIVVKILLLLSCWLVFCIRNFPEITFRFISTLISPIVRLYIFRRIARGLEDRSRQYERLGFSSQERPKGKLVWIHAVSVGETLSVIPLIKELKKANKNLNVLLTTTTLTSAEIVKKHVKDTVIHQFAPFDVFSWVRRFIKHWNPDAAFFVESELWPNTLYYAKRIGIPLYLLNVRISTKSMRRFNFANKIFKISPFCVFSLVVAPSNEIKNFTIKLGAQNVIVMPNMKTMAKKLPVNQKNVQKLKKKIGNRNVWMAVSTHEGEEEIVIEIHKNLKECYPDLLTVIAIRHPNRLNDVSKLCCSLGVSCTNHTSSSIGSSGICEEIYILNQIGYLGNFFEIIDTVLVCGSLVPGIGGHNFIEPLQFNCNVATGRYIENFEDIHIHVRNCCNVLSSPNDIYFFVKESLENYQRNSHSAKYTDFGKQWRNLIKKISVT